MNERGKFVFKGVIKLKKKTDRIKKRKCELVIAEHLTEEES